MKRLIALIAMLLAAALAAGADATYGEHGMVLFGGPDGLYASHLPMFHAPHDYQVVLRLRLADPAQDGALRARLGGKTALWTLAPEKFEIDRLAPGAAHPLTSFKADLVLGHFEQGGKTQYAGAGIIVEQVLLFRRLSAAVAQAPTARYIQLGTGAQRYLVKLIDSRPDFDHIVAVRAPRTASRQVIDVPKQGLIATPPAALQRALPGAMVTGTVYFSSEDLK